MTRTIEKIGSQSSMTNDVTGTTYDFKSATYNVTDAHKNFYRMPHLNHVHDGRPGMPDGENVLDLNPHTGGLGSLVDDLDHGRAEDRQLDDQP